MKYCAYCGKEIMDEAVLCVACGHLVQPISDTAVDESISEGLPVLSVFMPLFGLIYWAVKAKSRPHCAKACGLAAIITLALYLALAAIVFAVELGVFG